ncbi:hypothetical protein [Sphingomonas yabuuchiae]|uniref:hypothetical protein n=1 Tax=Sphingomonas yabuuchiae TaxID=172044 RepID=UPI001F08911B|nr:hypothetical protein [Sphingomonas yabuuchiae]
MSGRPLRFLGGVVGLWTLGRIAFLLPSDPAVVIAVRPVKRTEPRAALTLLRGPVPHQPEIRLARFGITRAPRPTPLIQGPAPPSPIPAAQAPIQDRPVIALAPSVIPLSPRVALPTPPAPPRRWSASLWAVIREGGQTLLPGGQLGGTQGGIRLLRRLDSRGDVAASLRLSAPAEGIGREMAVGVDWRPLRHVPIHLLVEQRLALDAGQDAPAAMVVGGIGPRSVAPGIVLTGYAQAGAVARARIEPFADGAVRASTPLTPALDLGLALWGGAQRDAQRLDIGPTLGIALPVANRRVRLSLDWRQRVAGRAAPDSGPALTLAGDF